MRDEGSSLWDCTVCEHFVQATGAALATYFTVMKLPNPSLRPLAFLLVACLGVAGAAVLPATEEAAEEPGEEPTAELAERHREWLERVAFLITEEERAFFLALDRDFRRDAFIEEFWRRRDPFDDTHTNELRRDWQERAARALSEWGSLEDDRAKVLLLNGPPFHRCWHRTRELEIWFYAAGERVSEDLALIFERTVPSRPYVLWRAGLPLRYVSRRKLLAGLGPREACEQETIDRVLDLVARNPFYDARLLEMLAPPEPPSEEWLATFAARSTAVPADAAAFDADLRLDFPGRHGQRTVVQGTIAVPAAELAAASTSGGDVHQLLLTGEVVRDGTLFDDFRYRYELPTGAATVPVVFQRYLRPGEVTLLLKLEDLHGRRFAHLEHPVDVPNVDAVAADVPGPADSELGRLLAEAEAATARGERSVRLVPPPGVVHTGLVRFDTVTVGDVARVSFLLDGTEILTKNRPPYSVELDLGAIPGTHRLRARGFDSEGGEVAGDEILLNPGGQRFRVRLIEPQSGERYQRSVRAAVDVQLPDGAELDRVELYLDERRVATLYQPPFVQPIVLEDDRLAYLRAVAYLTDGNSTEEVVFINAPGEIEEVDVHLVELYATVRDRDGRPVTGLGEEAFAVAEDGVPQEIRRFAWMDDLPIHAALLLDTSSSMADSLEAVSAAALGFVESILRPRDRAALVAFAGQPRVEEGFTSDVSELAADLGTLRAEGGTALYDSLVFTLHYFHGVKGQRALLLLTDGEDESSAFDFEGVLEYARRAGVTVYAIGLEEAALDRGARKILRQLADETGGRSFFPEATGELPAIYRRIEEELRSRYLLTYQSTSRKDPSEFRRVEVTVEGEEPLEVSTMAGYYP